MTLIKWFNINQNKMVWMFLLVISYYFEQTLNFWTVETPFNTWNVANNLKPTLNFRRSLSKVILHIFCFSNWSSPLIRKSRSHLESAPPTTPAQPILAGPPWVPGGAFSLCAAGFEYWAMPISDPNPHMCPEWTTVSHQVRISHYPSYHKFRQVPRQLFIFPEIIVF